MALRRMIFLMIACLAPAILRAEAPMRPVTSAVTLGIGSATLADTYLTPLTYRGLHFGVDYERFQAMRARPENLIMQLSIAASADRALNTAGNSVMWDARLTASWGMMRRWRNVLTPGLTLAVGGSTGIDAGALYLARNGNNPVSAKAAWTVNATAMATYSTRLGRIPLILRYQPTLPLIGAFFAPDYGELYYEIWLGNHSGLLHAAWPGNRFAMTNLLTADFRFGATALRIGYSGEILSSRVNDITTRRLTHALVIGISWEWMSLSPTGKHVSNTPVISDFY